MSDLNRPQNSAYHAGIRPEFRFLEPTFKNQAGTAAAVGNPNIGDRQGIPVIG